MIISPSQLPESHFDNSVTLFAGTAIPKYDKDEPMTQVDYDRYRRFTQEDVDQSKIVAKVKELGEKIANETNWHFTWGSGDVGLMDVVSDTFHKLTEGTKRLLSGISLFKYLNLGTKKADPENRILIEAPDTRSERMRKLLLSKFAIACPGGTGTFDELVNALEELKSSSDTTRVLGIYNVDGFFDKFLDNILKDATELGFVNKKVFDEQVVISDDPSFLVKEMQKKHQALIAKQDTSDESILPRLTARTKLPFLSNGEALSKAERLAEEVFEKLPGISNVESAVKNLFGTDDLQAIKTKLKELDPDAKGEIHELVQAIEQGNKKEIGQELGDVVFNLVALAKKHTINLGEAITHNVNKLTRRFNSAMNIYEKAGHSNLADIPRETKQKTWKQVKELNRAIDDKEAEAMVYSQAA